MDFELSERAIVLEMNDGLSARDRRFRDFVESHRNELYAKPGDSSMAIELLLKTSHNRHYSKPIELSLGFGRNPALTRGSPGFWSAKPIAIVVGKPFEIPGTQYGERISLLHILREPEPRPPATHYRCTRPIDSQTTGRIHLGSPRRVHRARERRAISSAHFKNSVRNWPIHKTLWKERKKVLIPSIVAATVAGMMLWFAFFRSIDPIASQGKGDTGNTVADSRTTDMQMEETRWVYYLFYPSELVDADDNEDGEIFPDEYLAIAGVFLSPVSTACPPSSSRYHKFNNQQSGGSLLCV